ncbi:S8 family serine peptidase [uncultured Kordia sp.]|uniref:S8 family serine peptidase n=1 Tax=uncultured Kordia sp. TaxID=507699 RepID=UPI0026210789|nr:S8 family serine peptidase [uncultured Kordia sp.]
MKTQTTVIETLSGIDKLWAKTEGDPTITIAVLDGPVDLQHETLKDASITSLDVPVLKKVKSKHGTFVSSLIFANHASGISGIAPNCSGLVKSIYPENGHGKLLSSSQADIEQGIRIALEHNADIINISGGEKLNEGETIISSLAAALELCEEKGVLVIAATGNEGDDNMHVPASYPTVLAVGSIKNNGLPSTFSNWSNATKAKGIVAPGENIVGAVPNNEHTKAISRGTSFSTALVSGIAGLLASLQKQQGMEKDLLAIRQILLSSVTPCTLDEKINCDRIMTGRLHIGNALESILKTTAQKSEHTLAKTSSCTCTTKPQNFLTINNTNMENQTETTPSAATNDLTNTTVTQVTPVEQQTSSAQPDNTAVTASEVQVSSHSYTTGVLPSQEEANSFNPAINPGGYPTFKNCQLVNAIGQPSYDFGTRNNLDTFTALMKTWYDNLPKIEDNGKREQCALAKALTDSPHDHKSMAAFLLYIDATGGKPNIFMISQLIWLLNVNASPMYTISPRLATFSDPIYLIMTHFLADNVGINYTSYSKYLMKLNDYKNDPDKQAQYKKELKNLPKDLFTKDDNKDDVMRMSLPGYISGRSKLINGNYIQAVTPVAYGLKDWTLEALLKSMGIKKESEDKKGLVSVLNRLYVEALNKGQSPDDRALNYCLYNILEISTIVKETVKQKQQFSSYKIVPSKVTRQNSIVREVQLTFFDPKNTNKAATTYSMEVDVSGITPVLIGRIEEWYAPVSTTIINS